MSSVLQSSRYLIILIDTALAAAIVFLLIRLIRYVRKRRTCREIEIGKPIRWSVMFDRLLREDGEAQAVIETFKKIINDLNELTKLNLPESLTSLEAIVKIGARLPEAMRRRLIELYKIYEPTRFGGIDLSEEEINEFRARTVELEKMCRIIMGELP